MGHNPRKSERSLDNDWSALIRCQGEVLGLPKASLNSSSQQAKATGSIIRLMRKQRAREIKQLACSDTIIKWWDLEIDLCPSGHKAKTVKHHSVVT